MDVTLVRAGLVPAFMRLAGDANWWAPRWMVRFRRWLHFSSSRGTDTTITGVTVAGPAPTVAIASAGTTGVSPGSISSNGGDG